MSDKQEKSAFPFPYPCKHNPTELTVPENIYKHLQEVGVLIPVQMIAINLAHAASKTIEGISDGSIEEATDFIFVWMSEFLTGLCKVLAGVGYGPGAAAVLMQSVAGSFKGRVLTVDNRDDALAEAMKWNEGPLFYLNVEDAKVECIPPFYHEHSEDRQINKINGEQVTINVTDILRRMTGGRGGKPSGTTQ